MHACPPQCRPSALTSAAQHFSMVIKVDAAKTSWSGAQVLNLVLAANATHEWYHKKFPDYPKQRKALIPFVY